MANGELPIPLEIPWRLASTTQELKAGDPEDASISLFFYQPILESLATDYPDENLIYLKFVVSCSPIADPDPAFSDLAKSFLEGGLPVWLLLLELKLTPVPEKYGGIRPYFHAASPLHRSMIQSGIVGHEVFEGEAEGVSIGKSGSQMHENVSSKTKTTGSQSGASAAFVFPLPGTASTSSMSSTTAVDSDRNVDQFVESTARDASTERRELLSHTTRVDNILTLLTARHLGSPYLRFALWPRPLYPLSVAPADPSTWYSELLHRRSSGIEGIQEFTAVVVVPKGSGFCVQACMRRVSILDDPPVPPDLSALGLNITVADRIQIDEYLRKTYPVGTAFDDLDVDLVPEKNFPTDKSDKLVRAAVREWLLGGDQKAMFGVGLDPLNQGPFGAFLGQGFHRIYKTYVELRLEMLRANYEQELARSPLERGAGQIRNTGLTTCFGFGADGRFNVANFNELGCLQFPTLFDPARVLDHRQDVSAAGASASQPERSKYTRTVMKWNELEQQLARQLPRLATIRDANVEPGYPKIVQIFLNRWEKLSSDDPRNVPLTAVVSMFGLTDHQKRSLISAGAEDLRGLARAVNAAPRIERLNARMKEFSSTLANELPRNPRGSLSGKKKGKSAPLPRLEPMKFPLSASDAVEIRKSIAQALRA